MADRILALADGYGVRVLFGDMDVADARREIWAAIAPGFSSPTSRRRFGEAPRRTRSAALALLVLAAPAAAQPLTVQTFNVWYGGGQVEFDRIGNAIKAAGADVVGIQEPEGNLRRIADVAGHVATPTRRST